MRGKKWMTDSARDGLEYRDGVDCAEMRRGDFADEQASGVDGSGGDVGRGGGGLGQ